VTISVTAFTDTGLSRARNEDAVLVGGWMCQTSRGSVASMIFPDAAPFVCAVADGMGGHSGGDLASRVALGVLADAAASITSADDVVAALHAANERVFQIGHNPDLRGLGTTIAGICVLAEDVIIFNVGDSRIYTISDGYLQQVSIDDALTDERGRPTNVITQSLGQRTRVAPHVTTMPRNGTTYLICSDGVSGTMSPAELRGAALRPDPAEIAAAIIDATTAAGAGDNFSFALAAPLAVTYGPPPDERPEAAELATDPHQPGDGPPERGPHEPSSVEPATQPAGEQP
jgi:protein phosphatase